MQFEKLVTNKAHYSFFHELKDSLLNCNKFDLSIAFISFSGLQTLLDELYILEQKNIPGRIITTNYMFGTDPKALKKLLTFKNIEVKVYDSTKTGMKGFHTKGYMFDRNDDCKIIIGSSNLTTSALKTNQEWNAAFIGKDDSVLKNIKDEYEYLWEQSTVLDDRFITNYEKSFIRNKQNESQELYEQILNYIKQTNDINRIEEFSKMFNIEEEIILDELNEYAFNLNSMQEAGLESLNQIRQNGEKKALVIAATGTGKTYLAAYDVQSFNPNRVLYIAHRARILEDAKKSFSKIIKFKEMGILTGSEKDYNADYLFATNTMAAKMVENLEFKSDHFDYIIIDEAHRASASTYLKIINYFKPKFILGLTATPERTDSLSIFKLFDHNIAVETRLRDALGSGLVVPFHYYGINDISTDLSKIDITDIDKVADKLSINKRVELIIEHINKYEHDGKKTKALGFCVNKKHSQYMADKFNSYGYESIALTGDNTDEERNDAIARLESSTDNLKYIFTVDIFNEGIDIPSINLVLMLRPTQSSIIFTQQLGRGLRKYKHKEFLTVLDFIGNHNKNFLIPMALSGNSAHDKDDLKESVNSDFFDTPGETFIRLDETSKERILDQLDKVNFNNKRYLREFYLEKKNEIQSFDKNIKFPTLDNFEVEGFDPVKFIKSSGYYLKFVSEVEDISDINEIVNDARYFKYLRFIDELLPIKEPVIFMVLEYLLEFLNVDVSKIYETISKKFEITMDDIKYALSYLSGHYFDQNDSKKYSTFIKIDDNDFTLSVELLKCLNNQFFKNQLNHSISYGLLRYGYEFKEKRIALKLHQLYSRKNLAILFKYMKKSSGFANSTGLFLHESNYFIFVNLDKEHVRESINYADEFLSPQIFQWESPNATTVSSVTGQNLIYYKNKNINIHLFIRKNEKEDGIIQDFTYFGLVDPVQKEGEKPIKFELILKNRVPLSIYERFLLKKK